MNFIINGISNWVTIQCEVKIGEEVIDQVEEMKYLGVMISSDGRMEKEVEARIGSATRVIGGMNEAVLKRKELSRSTKLTVVNATMMPALMYLQQSQHIKYKELIMRERTPALFPDWEDHGLYFVSTHHTIAGYS